MDTALVTGANRGIGFAIAEGLVAAGLRVFTAARRADAARRTADALGGEPVVLDVADPASREAAASALPTLDVVVHNAGVALDGFDGPVVRRTLAVNTHGPMALTRSLPLAPGARVVAVSSGLGELSGMHRPHRARFADPELTEAGLRALLEEFQAAVDAGTSQEAGWPSSAYRVSKAGLNAWVRITARDRSDLSINAACPGWVATDMGGAHAPRTPAQGADTPIWLALTPPGSGRFYRDRLEIPY
jgi:carbonyl reductase 1